MKVHFKMELSSMKGSHQELISLGPCQIVPCSFMFSHCWVKLFPPSTETIGKVNRLLEFSEGERSFQHGEDITVSKNKEIPPSTEMSTVSKSTAAFSLKDLQDFVGQTQSSSQMLVPKREMEAPSVGARVKKRKSSSKEVIVLDEMGLGDAEEALARVAVSIDTAKAKMSSLEERNRKLVLENIQVKKQSEAGAKKIGDLQKEVESLMTGMSSLQDTQLHEIEDLKKNMMASAAQSMVAIKTQMMEEFYAGKHTEWNVEQQCSLLKTLEAKGEDVGEGSSAAKGNDILDEGATSATVATP